MTIKNALFIADTVAHLQGREREILPVTESARAEHALMIYTLQEARSNLGARKSHKAVIDLIDLALEFGK